MELEPEMLPLLAMFDLIDAAFAWATTPAREAALRPWLETAEKVLGIVSPA